LDAIAGSLPLVVFSPSIGDVGSTGLLFNLATAEKPIRPRTTRKKAEERPIFMFIETPLLVKVEF
jgi:hypothetical protein